MTTPPPPVRSARRFDSMLLAAGVFQLAATLTPAARVKIVGGVSFASLPTAGACLVGLGMLTLTMALLPRGWWRWLPGALSGIVVAVLYWRLRHAPSKTFLDPLLRHTLHPAWGFVPMSIAILVSIAGAARAAFAPKLQRAQSFDAPTPARIIDEASL